MDDDAGWGDLSKLTVTLPADGQYLAIVGTFSGDGRGKYRLALDCAGESCLDVAVPQACPERVPGLVADCVSEYLVDSDYEGTRNEGFELCLGDYASDIYDWACESRWNAPEPWCPAGQGSFMENIVPACKLQLAPEYPAPREPIPLSGASVPDLVEEAVWENDCDYCGMDISAYTLGEVEGDVDFPWILETIHRGLEYAPDQASYDSDDDFKVGLEQLGGDTNELMEALYEAAGSRSYRSGRISWSWYVAAGAEEWTDVYVAWFDSGYIVALDIRVGED